MIPIQVEGMPKRSEKSPFANAPQQSTAPSTALYSASAEDEGSDPSPLLGSYGVISSRCLASGEGSALSVQEAVQAHNGIAKCYPMLNSMRRCEHSLTKLN